MFITECDEIFSNTAPHASRNFCSFFQTCGTVHIFYTCVKYETFQQYIYLFSAFYFGEIDPAGIKDLTDISYNSISTQYRIYHLSTLAEGLSTALSLGTPCFL